MTTLLQIIQAATGELGLAQPTLVVGSTTTDVIQLLSLANAVGGDLQRKYIWQALSTEYRFTTQYLQTTGTTTSGSAVLTGLGSTTNLDSTYSIVGTGINQDTYVSTVDSGTQVTMNQAASASGTVTINFAKTKYSFPSDYDRPIDKTQWDKSKHWMMLGPETPQQWQWLKSGYIATGPRIRYRQLGGYFQIWPAVTVNEYLGFEYISKNWVTSSAGTGKSSFTADDDTCIFPDRLMITALKMYYQRAKGLGTEYVDDYAEQFSIAQGNDSGSATLSMAPRLSSILINWDNIPDSGFGQ